MTSRFLLTHQVAWLPVRHQGYACARVVQRVLRDQRPTWCSSRGGDARRG